jgi:tRNA-(ms[2]io[6]A)-hydroxylase
MLKLRSDTPKDWLDIVFSDFDSFLIDHAACERKASASDMSFIVRYPDRQAILEPLIKMAREELEHFHQVYNILTKRGLKLGPDTKDEYVNLMLKNVRTGGEERLLDKLIASAVIEARGCERLGLVTDALEDPELKEFYRELTRCEARHHSQFIRLASHYFAEETISKRLEEFLDLEAEAITKVPFRAALY